MKLFLNVFLPVNIMLEKKKYMDINKCIISIEKL